MDGRGLLVILLGILFILIGVTGKPGSMLGAFLTPKNMTVVSPSNATMASVGNAVSPIGTVLAAASKWLGFAG